MINSMVTTRAAKTFIIYYLIIISGILFSAISSAKDSAVPIPVASVKSSQESAIPQSPPIPKSPMNVGSESTTIFPYENRVVVLMYHHLAPVAETGSTITPKRFKEHMEFLRDNGFNIISMRAFTTFLEGRGSLPPKAVLITFDDGYESLYTYAYPILKEFAFPATCFTVVADTGMVAPGGIAKHLSWEQMIQLQRSGLITFGSHTYNQHGYIQTGENGITRPALTVKRFDTTTGITESDDEYSRRIFDDLLLSKRLLEQHLGTTIDTIAFPYGATNPQVKEMTRRTGFRFMFNIKPGVITEQSDWTELNRINAGSERITDISLAESISSSVFESITSMVRSQD